MVRPIIFVHRGYADYLYFALHQVHYSNPHSSLILISDQKYDHLDFVKQYDICNYSEKAIQFKNVYRHMSKCTYSFELAAFQRLLILGEFMCKENIQDSFSFDSDVLIYSDLENAYGKLLQNIDFGYCVVAQDIEISWAGSVHICYWKRDAITDYSEFLIQSFKDGPYFEKYQQKWKNHQAQPELGGGVTEMTALYFYYKKHDNVKKFYNLSEVTDGASTEWTISTPNGKNLVDEYRMKNRIKDIAWNDGFPYVYNFFTSSDVKLHFLHFQGSSKLLMPDYYTGPEFVSMNRIILRNKIKICKGKIRNFFAWIVKNMLGRRCSYIPFP